MRSTRNLLAGVAAAALALSACTSSGNDPQPTPPTNPDIVVDLSSYLDQDVDWGECSEEVTGGDVPVGAECAVVQVPATYEQESDLDDLDAQLLRLPATDPDKRQGVMLVNPGGPGSAGTQYAVQADWPDEIRESYDIIGFDPRGTGASSPIQCLDGDQFRELAYGTEPTPQGEDEWQESDSAEQQVFDDCIAEHPWWWTLSTTNTVHDMDVIRQLLGEDSINYFGASYGTWLGAEYLTEYPEHSNRFTLDSPSMSYTRPAEDSQVQQTAAVEAAIRAMAQGCADDPECPGSTVDEVLATFESLVRQVDEDQLTSPFGVEPASGGQLGATVASEQLVIDGLILLSYFPPEDSSPLFTQGMQQLADGNPALFEAYGLIFNGFDPESLTGTLERRDYTQDAFKIISCVDQDSTSTPEQEEELLAALQQEAPFLAQLAEPHGYLNSADPQPGCRASWAALADDTIPAPPKVLPAPVNDSGRPILLVGTKGDNATPYADAVAMAAALGSPLLTYEGGGHAQAFANDCTMKVVVDYMVRGELIAESTTCPA